MVNAICLLPSSLPSALSNSKSMPNQQPVDLSLLTKMLANLPVEIILLICEYPEFKELGQLAWTNNRIMRIIKRYLPTALERRTLFYRPDPPEWRKWASVVYFKDKLYYLGGRVPGLYADYSNRVEVENGKQDLLFLFQLAMLKQ
ncbi:hypothetical protein WR25_05887 [Diploscapter pachys]|uniref:F-box domain-containing protein n=1 Tax=Diploscapter pachys TaxID=2018661 RepID=A0A2A2J4J6_9BILA|nr:hypothetical protein WR25_05887 [Diploscapter pachys]